MPVTFAGADYGTTTGATYTTTTSNSSNSTVWYVWTSQATSTTTATYTLTGTWTGWNLVYAGDGVQWHDVRPVTSGYSPPPLTEEQRAEREERQRANREAAEKQAAEQAAAIAKARALLEGFLTSEQIAQLAAQHWFEIVSQKGNRYRIHQGQRGNVRFVKPDGSLGTRYCIHPGEYVPDEDAMLAQKLLLETDEDSFVRIANKS